MIRVEHLTKHFGMTKALDDISFEVQRGEILGFLGPNGAGKTTTMRIITGILAPSEGTVFIDGVNIRKDPLTAQRKIGYLPESVPIYKDMLVDDYLQFVAGMKNIPRGERRKKIDFLCERCGLEAVKYRLVGNMSKGYRQRIGLAQALLGDPAVLILDEPTEGLDPGQIIAIRNLIKELAEERTILLSTHILPEVSMTCGRVIILNKGKVIAVDTPENLNKNLQHRKTITLTIRGPELDTALSIKNIPGVISVDLHRKNGDEFTFHIESADQQDIRAQLAEYIVNNKWQLLELHSEHLSLEDIFIQLVTQEQEVPE